MKESPIHRRELLLVGAGAVMAKALTVTTACAGTNADKKAAPADMPPPRAEPGPRQQFRSAGVMSPGVMSPGSSMPWQSPMQSKSQRTSISGS